MTKNSSTSTATSSSPEAVAMNTWDIEKGQQMRSKKHRRTQNLEHEKAKDNYQIDGTCFEPCEMHSQWKLEDSEATPYLNHVKKLSNQWKSLHQLVMFMEAGTTPKSRWHLDEHAETRQNRLNRTNVTFFEYRPGEDLEPISIDDHRRLRETLDERLPKSSTEAPLRLFIVEDLSRQVIEQLGARFDIDPLFFREHIHDYVWLNMRDSWAMPPSLRSSIKRRKWFRLRNMRLRYHTTEASYETAKKEAEDWNVHRRPDNDRNHWAHNDEVEKDGKGNETSKAVVSILRTRTTIWIGKDKQCGNGTVGIVLLDPTLEEGRPLWYDRPNWLPTPSMYPESPDSAPLPESTVPGSTIPGSTLPEAKATWYKDIVAKTAAYPWFEEASGHDIGPQVLALPTLYTICAEWLIICDYVRARLSQIEWEIEMPEVFRKEDPKDVRSKSQVIGDSLHRLHTWRRLIPSFRDMVNEAIQQALPAAALLMDDKPDPKHPSMNEIQPDFKQILDNITALQERVDRLTAVVTSEVNMEDSKQSQEDNHNLARLTWLATIFIPLSFVSTLFSMNESVAALKYTYGWFFLTAIPFTTVCLLVAQQVGGGKVGQKVSDSDSFYKKYLKFK